MDALYEHDVTGLYALVAAQAWRRLGLVVTVGHRDSRSFHVDGAYNSTEEAEAQVVPLPPGYRRDHRPDLNPVLLKLLVEHRAGIALLMKPLAGNGSDTVELAALIDEHRPQLRTAYDLDYGVADSALYREDTLRLLADHQLKWIPRVPARLNLAKEALPITAKGRVLRVTGVVPKGSSTLGCGNAGCS